MRETTYLFTGLGGEYVLGPLAAYFRAKGHRTVEWDFLKPDDHAATLQQLMQQDIVLVSTSHPDFDAFSYEMSYKAKPYFLSTLELFTLLKPVASFYVPHDLTTPMHDTELRWLPYFTAFLSPLPNLWWMEKYTRVIETGWVRKCPQTDGAYQLKANGNRHKWMLFPTFIEYHRELGPEGLYELYRPLFQMNIPIKFPAWPGVDAMEDGLRERGVEVIPASVSPHGLIAQADAVICISLSSTAVETYLDGIPLICLTDVIVSPEQVRHYLSGLFSAQFMTREAAAQQIAAVNAGEMQLPARQPSSLLPFDFEKAYAVITSMR